MGNTSCTRTRLRRLNTSPKNCDLSLLWLVRCFNIGQLDFFHMIIPDSATSLLWLTSLGRIIIFINHVLQDPARSTYGHPTFPWDFFLFFFSKVYCDIEPTNLNPLTAERALRAPKDFTLSNARRFYSSMGNPLDGWGLSTLPLISIVYIKESSL